MEVQDLFLIATTAGPPVISVIGLAFWLGGRLKGIESRFDQIQERFNVNDKRFEEQFKDLSTRLARVEAKQDIQDKFIHRMQGREHEQS